MSKFDIEDHPFFMEMCDEMVSLMDNDPELADGIRWLDQQAQKKGCTFYDMVYEVMYVHDVRKKARDWLRNKDGL